MPSNQPSKTQPKRGSSKSRVPVKTVATRLYHIVPPEQQPWDPIFFRKIDINRGTILIYHGRMAPQSRWQVQKIVTDLGFGRGGKVIETVIRMNDRVAIACLDNPRLARETTFGHLSYSAIWRLPEEQPIKAEKTTTEAKPKQVRQRVEVAEVFE